MDFEDIEDIRVLSVDDTGIQKNSLGVFTDIPTKTLYLAARNSLIATDHGVFHVEDIVVPFENCATFSEKRLVNIIDLYNGLSIATGGENKVVVYTKQMRVMFKTVKSLAVGDIVILTKGFNSFGYYKTPIEVILGHPFREANKARAPITVPIYLTKKLARVLGFVGAIDCIRAGKIEFAHDKHILEIFKNDMHDTFNNIYTISETPEENVGGGSKFQYMVKNTSVEMLEYIGYLLHGNTTAISKILPKIVFRSGKENAIEYLKALTLSGRVIKNGFVICRVVDFKFVREIIVLLSQFNINAFSKKHGTMKVYKSIKEQNVEVPAFSIVVQGHDAISFFNTIGFIQPKKHALAGKMIKILKDKLPKSELIPNMGLSRKLLNGVLSNKITLPKKLMPYFTKETVGNPLPLDTLKELRDIGIDVPEMLVNDNLTFTHVVSNTVSSYPVNTYDVYADESVLFTCNNVIMKTEKPSIE